MRTSLLLRGCGDCRACCTPLAITELRKPAGVPCPHIDPNGKHGCCGIYETRPRSCAEYFCAWRLGGTSDDDERPDRSGVVFTSKANAVQACRDVPGLLPMSYLAHETRPRAFREAATFDVVERVGGRGVIVFALYGEGFERCKLVGPADLVRRAMVYTKGDIRKILEPGSIISIRTGKRR